MHLCERTSHRDYSVCGMECSTYLKIMASARSGVYGEGEREREKVALSPSHTSAINLLGPQVLLPKRCITNHSLRACMQCKSVSAITFHSCLSHPGQRRAGCLMQWTSPISNNSFFYFLFFLENASHSPVYICLHVTPIYPSSFCWPEPNKASLLPVPHDSASSMY